MFGDPLVLVPVAYLGSILGAPDIWKLPLRCLLKFGRVSRRPGKVL